MTIVLIMIFFMTLSFLLVNTFPKFWLIKIYDQTPDIMYKGKPVVLFSFSTFEMIFSATYLGMCYFLRPEEIFITILAYFYGYFCFWVALIWYQIREINKSL